MTINSERVILKAEVVDFTLTWLYFAAILTVSRGVVRRTGIGRRRAVLRQDCSRQADSHSPWINILSVQENANLQPVKMRGRRDSHQYAHHKARVRASVWDISIKLAYSASGPLPPPPNPLPTARVWLYVDGITPRLHILQSTAD